MLSLAGCLRGVDGQTGKSFISLEEVYFSAEIVTFSLFICSLLKQFYRIPDCTSQSKQKKV
jgi:hypothetical protein